MKKRILTSTFMALVALFAMPIGAWGQTIKFDNYKDKTAEGAADNLEISSGDFKVYLDGGSRSKIGQKSLTFVVEGSTTADNREQFSYQYCPGGGVEKTSGERSITLTIPKAGKLYVYPRYDSGTPTLTIKQGGNILVNAKAINDTDNQTEINGQKYHVATESVVTKGTVNITTSGIINFSAFKFVADTYTFKATACEGGTISAQKGDDDVTNAVAEGTSYEVETNIKLTATASDGYHFVGWKSGSTTVSSNPEYTIESLAENTKLTAEFAKDTYTLDTSITGNGTIELRKDNATGDIITSGTVVEWGTTVYVSATPTGNYVLTSLKYGETDITNGGTLEMPKVATTVTAVFTESVGEPTALTANSVSFAGLGTADVAMNNASYFTVDETDKKYSTNSTSASSIYANGAVFTYSRADGVFTLNANALSANKPLCSINVPGVSGGQMVFVRIAGNSNTTTIISCTEGGTIDTGISSTTLATNSAYGGASDIFVKVNDGKNSITLQNTNQGFNLFRIALAQKLTTSISGATGDITITPAVSSTPAVDDANLGNGYFVKGTEVTVTAPTIAGYTFKNWTNESSTEVVSTENAYTFTLSDDVTLTANYETAQQAVSVMRLLRCQRWSGMMPLQIPCHLQVMAP